MEKKILVLGAGGFIGGHLVSRLKKGNNFVRGIDLKFNEYNPEEADDFVIGDLRDKGFVESIIDIKFDEVYQLAADMGGAGYIFTGNNDADIMQNSAHININILDCCMKRNIKNIFYSSSACIYPAYNQNDPDDPRCDEASAYPAEPDSEYGWEKLFSERLYLAYNRNYGLNCKIGRFHNIFGTNGTWFGGKEKAPAAICRKIAMAKNNSNIEIWGDGLQTRSFLYINDCIDAVLKLMKSKFSGPYNIGSEEMITINDLALLVAKISNKRIGITNIEGPQGVRGRNSHNKMIKRDLNWSPKFTLEEGLEITYPWILNEIQKQNFSSYI